MDKRKHLSLNRRRLYVVSNPIPNSSSELIDKIIASGVPEEAIIINNEENDSSLVQGEALSRLKKELITVVVDNNCITEQDKFSYNQIAEEANVKPCFIAVNKSIDEIKDYASKGDHGQMYQTIVNKGRAYISSLKMPSEYDGIKYDSDYTLSFEDIKTQLQLDELHDPEVNRNEGIITNFDGYILGDVHGMYDDMIDSLNSLGFNTEKGYAEHPKGKQILFIGDLVDRGKRSADVLEFTMNTVERGNGHLILGNHETMLLDGLHKVVKQGGQAIPDSLASGDTIASVVRHKDPDFPNKVYDFLSKSPSSLRLVINDCEIECIHAPVNNKEGITPKKHRTHGKNIGTFDDSGFKEVESPNNKLTVCGHMTQPMDKIVRDGKEYKIPMNIANVMSLDFNGCSTTRNKQGHLGYLDTAKMSSLHQVKQYPLAKAALLSVEKFETRPNSYRFEIAQRSRLAKELGDCIDNDELDVVKSSNNYYLYLPKEDIYEEGRMYEKPIFADIAGSIGVDNGMKVLFIGPSKSYVLGDDKPLLDDNQEVLKVDNVRGFNVMVSRDEYGKGLIVTTASRENDSRYVEMAEEMLVKTGVYDKVNTFLGDDDKNMTLTFKVRHPDDKRNRISEDSEEKYGVTLMSARKNQAYSPMISEKYLNYISLQMDIKRPNVEKTLFKDVFDYKKDIQKIREGADINAIDGKNFILRTRKDSKVELYSDYYNLPTANAVMKKVNNDLTPNKIDDILKSRGAVMKRQDFFYQKAMTDIINSAIKEDRLDELKDRFDLKKLRERKDIAPEDKRKISQEVKEEKKKLVCNAVEKSFDEISGSQMRCNPVKYEKITSNIQKAQEQERKEKEIKERRKHLNSLSP